MVIIRADANEQIGSGHIMRCISIAKELTHRGEPVLFITADHRSDKIIEQNGFEAHCIDTEWTRMDEEIPIMIQIIRQSNPFLVIVDSYFATEYYLRQLSANTKVAYFDDLNIHHWDVDYLINYNVYSSVFDYSAYENSKTKMLLTPKYAPLRAEFENLSNHVIREKVSDILVSAGGSDPEGISLQLMKRVCPKHPELRFHFVVGLLNTRINEIKTLESENIILHINEKNMSALMTEADIAISAAGTTLYELCATGIPTMTYILADNQIEAAAQFDSQGIMISLGDCRKDCGFIDRTEDNLIQLVNDVERRKELSTKMQKLVDGNGVIRIVDRLLNDAK